MILGIGIDLLDVPRVAAELAEGDNGFVLDLFTPGEIAYCDSKRYPARHYAARLAAKEAVFKALGGCPPPHVWRDVEVVSGGDGPPKIALHGALESSAKERGVRTIFVSLSHTDELATASVVLEG
ncbi:MAG: holo-ACP synthase [Acidobacteria bacterium]|nr:holo-ACP synthase [Acidobacteriota bacterium]MCG3193141.1 Holo-[acyl-carrier-protein] synthase [Thermoanaerobaculia bacterium]